MVSSSLLKDVKLNKFFDQRQSTRLFSVICSSINRDAYAPPFPVEYFISTADTPAFWFLFRASARYRGISINYSVVIAFPIMDDTRLYKYYRTYSGYGLNSLIYRFLIADYNLRRFFNLSAYCGAVTFVTFIFVVIMIACSIASLNLVTLNDTFFRDLVEKAEKKLPRMESVVNVIPSYKCIHKHIQRTSVFQEKAEKMLRKEQLQLEVMNSKMSCIEKLLKPEGQSEWRRSRSPKIYHRLINMEVSK
ncbi:uncharacterized protein [Cardiocondyla obscurior]|uniref:uncharacterized protein n=1 Tax=Cardiocondyla obscurior TaxID=286306 RepID=UPI00396586A0